MRSLAPLFLFPLLVVLPVAARDAAPAATVPDRYQPIPYVRVQHPEWTRDAAIYQINVRQFTVEGTFAAAEKELPRIKALGTDIVWLMPIHPIGAQNRKGVLGSPYAVRDYFGVNPEFGTLADLKRFVATAHGLGLRVILDWVANHTAWDNPLVQEHPEWYQRDWKGDFRPTPWFDWTDIINLDYRQPGLREYMTRAMKYWVTEADIDGYRCDVAGFVPLDFWNNVRRELDAIKPVFLLAEAQTRDLHAEAFDATYAWGWYEAMHAVAAGKANLGALIGYYSENEGLFPRGCMRLTFVSNHDKNAWDGTGPEQFGAGLEAAIVLSVVGEGIPMIYGGQEAGETKRLKFFEKDPIEWRAHPVGELYRKLFALKKANSTLWNGHWGALMIHVPNTAPDAVLSVVRRNDTDKVFAVFNFSKTPQKVKFSEALFPGRYTEYFTGEHAELTAASELELPPWSSRVFVK